MTDLEIVELALRRVAQSEAGLLYAGFHDCLMAVADNIRELEAEREQRENQREAKAKAAIRTTSSSD